MAASSIDLERLKALAERDGLLLAEAQSIESLGERTAALRRRSAEVLDALDRVPAGRASLTRAREIGVGRIAHAERVLAEAHEARAKAGKARRDRAAQVAVAEADERAAAEALADAKRHLERLAEESLALEAHEQGLRAESALLLRQAGELASEVASTHRVAAPAVHRAPETLAQLDDWGVEARAALFVASGSLAAERERLVAEANAVGSAALGEDVGALGVTQVLERLEASGA